VTTTVELADALKHLGLEVNEADVDWIASCDVAELNLACAKGLPGSDDLDIERCLTKLDEWAAHVQREIERHYYRFLQSPEKFNNSQGWFCVLMMITVLQQDFGVRYNPERIRDPDFQNSRDLFLHGLISGEGGTCASMPVLYAAIGRRLGYPIKLVHTRSHVFCRWDDPKGHHPFGADRFNIEGAGVGASSFADDYYVTWPEPIRAEDIHCGTYLRSLESKEELAAFLASRGHCLLDNGRLADARTAYDCSRFLAPNDPHYEAFHHDAQRRIDHANEHRILWLYFGPNARLPYGALQPQALRKLEFDMYGAMTELNNAIAKFQDERLAQERESVLQMATPPHFHHSQPPQFFNPSSWHSDPKLDQEARYQKCADLVAKLPFGEVGRLEQLNDHGRPFASDSRWSDIADRAESELRRRQQEVSVLLNGPCVPYECDPPKRLPKYPERHLDKLAGVRAI
jgi:hypothetical protein